MTAGIELARIALSRLGLVGRHKQRDHGPGGDEIDAIPTALGSNPRQSNPVAGVARFAFATACNKMISLGRGGKIITLAPECGSSEIAETFVARQATISAFRCLSLPTTLPARYGPSQGTGAVLLDETSGMRTRFPIDDVVDIALEPVPITGVSLRRVI